MLIPDLASVLLLEGTSCIAIHGACCFVESPVMRRVAAFFLLNGKAIELVEQLCCLIDCHDVDIQRVHS